MPKQAEANRLGREGERWFNASLPTDWILQQPLEDVGADGVVVICEDGPLNGSEFRVQVKTVKRWSVKENLVRVPRLKRDAVLYWLTGFTPTLLVVYNSGSRRGCCEWVNRIAAHNPDCLRGTSKTITLEVPIEREVGPALWDGLRSDLRAMNGLLFRRILSAGKALPLLRALHAMAGALHGFDFVAHATKVDGSRPDADREILHELEVSCHRDVVRSIRQLNDDLDASGYRIDGLSHFAQSYAEQCTSFIEDFEDLVADPTLLKSVRVDVASLEHRRTGFVRSVVAVMRQLTAIGLEVTPEHDESPR